MNMCFIFCGCYWIQYVLRISNPVRLFVTCNRESNPGHTTLFSAVLIFVVIIEHYTMKNTLRYVCFCLTQYIPERSFCWESRKTRKIRQWTHSLSPSQRSLASHREPLVFVCELQSAHLAARSLLGAANNALSALWKLPMWWVFQIRAACSTCAPYAGKTVLETHSLFFEWTVAIGTNTRCSLLSTFAWLRIAECLFAHGTIQISTYIRKNLNGFLWFSLYRKYVIINWAV